MRLATSVIALAVAIGIVVLPAIGVHSPAARAADTDGVTVEFAPTNTGVLAAGQPLVLNGTINNQTPTDVPAGTATVYLNRSPISTRSALADWLNPGATSSKDRLGTNVLETATPSVPAGRQANIQLVVPATAINFGSQAAFWGTRTLAVRISAAGSEVGQARSSIVWSTASGMGRTGLAIAVPLTVPPSSVGLIPADLLATYTAQGGLLTRQLNEVLNQNVAIGIDPRILASINILGTSTPPSALAWLDRLRAATNVTFALSYADYDLAAASQAKASSVLVPTSFPIDASLFPGATTATPTPTGSPSASQAPEDPQAASGQPSATPVPVEPNLPDVQSLLAWNYTLSSVAWPADNSVISSDLDHFTAAGLATTIVSSDNVGYGDLEYTPSAPTLVGSHKVLVSDSSVSSLFRSAANAIDMADWTVAITKLSSTLAVVARERPSETRTLLATLGRSLPGSNDRVAQTLAALGALPWVSSAPVTSLTASFGDSSSVANSAGTPVTATLVARPAPATRVAAVSSMLAAEAADARFASILTTPELVTGERRLSLLASLANAWPADETRLAEEKKYVKSSGAIRASVSIAKSSSVHIIATRSLVPVTVTNHLPWPVTVTVLVRSPNSLLTISDESVSLTIQAQSQAKVNVSVRANANGESRVSVRLSSPTAVPIAGPEFIDVDVQAGWETAFTAIVGFVLLAVFGFGIYRNVTKRRKATALLKSDSADNQVADATGAADSATPS